MRSRYMSHKNKNRVSGNFNDPNEYSKSVERFVEALQKAQSYTFAQRPIYGSLEVIMDNQGTFARMVRCNGSFIDIIC